MQVKKLLEKKLILMLPHPLAYFQMQKYYQSKTNFDSTYSRTNFLYQLTCKIC